MKLAYLYLQSIMKSCFFLVSISLILAMPAFADDSESNSCTATCIGICPSFDREVEYRREHATTIQERVELLQIPNCPRSPEHYEQGSDPKTPEEELKDRKDKALENLERAHEEQRREELEKYCKEVYPERPKRRGKGTECPQQSDRHLQTKNAISPPKAQRGRSKARGPSAQAGGDFRGSQLSPARSKVGFHSHGILYQPYPNEI